jgi:hypothetical protein
MVFACEEMAGEPFTFYFQLPDLLDYFGGSEHS